MLYKFLYAILSHCKLLNQLLDSINNNNLNKIDDSILLVEWKQLKELMKKIVQ